MLTVYTVEQSAQWDTVVRSFAAYDVYWLNGYVKAFQLHGDGEPLLFYYEDEAVRGINVVMKRDIAKNPHFTDKLPENTYFDFATPYGYGGWLIEGEQLDGLFNAYEAWCRENGIISEFVRFHPISRNHVFCQSVYEIVDLGNTVALDISSPDILWSNITSKNRNMIRKARKNGIQIYNGRYPEIYRQFKSIYDETMIEDHAEKYYFFSSRFYDSILCDLQQNAQVFYAVFEGKTIAASIFLYANGKMSYHLSGSAKEYAHLGPNNLLLYEAALWGSACGGKTLYLGGGVGSREDNLFKFKKSFYRGDDLNRFYIGKKVFLPEQYAALCEKREHLPQSSFFPAYRG